MAKESKTRKSSRTRTSRIRELAGATRLMAAAFLTIGMPGCAFGPATHALNADSPERAVRMMLQANADRNMAALEGSVDPGLVAYSIGGRKYTGWPELAQEMQQEFEATTRIEILIKRLETWERRDLAWYTVELEYVRYEGTGPDQVKTVLPLRESGILERRHGRWVLLHIHESLEAPPQTVRLVDPALGPSDGGVRSLVPVDLSGEWEIHEEDKSYRAALDASGHGTYTWQEGRITTRRLDDGVWEGTWHQAGNDREGGFEVVFSPDGQTAQGTWWYTRVGRRRNIPPRRWGGEYRLKRLSPPASNHAR
ncbi:nuclear transport factor 2 family protein [Candidatus Nitrospira bockiana]